MIPDPTPLIPTWDFRYLRMARIVARWSKDPSTQCGAILVRPDRTLASVGYNGFPRRAKDSPELYADRGSKYPRIIHSEWNAISNSRDSSLEGYTTYAWPMPPCNRCTGALVQKKIGRVVQPRPTEDKLQRWATSFSYAKDMLESKGIQVDFLDLPEDEKPWLGQFQDGTSTWTQRFLSVAREIASWSKDTVAPGGAVLVRADKTIASVGFSGFPQGIDDTPLLAADPEARELLLLSAERNALLFSQDPNHDGHTAYLWPGPPDLDGVSHLLHAGVTTVVYPRHAGESDMSQETRDWLEHAGGRAVAVRWK
jgi:dCMP deaminase